MELGFAWRWLARKEVKLQAGRGWEPQTLDGGGTEARSEVSLIMATEVGAEEEKERVTTQCSCGFLRTWFPLTWDL